MPSKPTKPSQSSPSTSDSTLLDFEQALAELEAIVQRMEHGEQTLQQALQDFERGMRLSAQCQQSLTTAQQRIAVLVKKHESYQLQALPESAGDEPPVA